jgi:NAD(P)-dependent dehydrogenase (short-subunit alcohol dehydrogenase family)
MGKLDGKVALITGGNSGIGLATAKRFVQEGAFVFVTGRTQLKLDEAVKQVGSNVTGVRGDVAKLGDLDRLFEQIQRDKGKLDIIFANAGIASYASLGTIDEEHFDSIFSTNVKGVVFTVQKALPLLPDGASIILNASVVGSKGLPANSVYSATKAALRSFARTWTTDLKGRKIRVNAISPGPIDTEGLRNLVGSTGAGEDRLKGLGSMVPLGRLGTADEIAKAAVFLASDDSSFVTGIELFGWRLRASIGSRSLRVHKVGLARAEDAGSEMQRDSGERAGPGALSGPARADRAGVLAPQVHASAGNPPSEAYFLSISSRADCCPYSTRAHV